MSDDPPTRVYRAKPVSERAAEPIGQVAPFQAFETQVESEIALLMQTFGVTYQEARAYIEKRGTVSAPAPPVVGPLSQELVSAVENPMGPGAPPPPEVPPPALSEAAVSNWYAGLSDSDKDLLDLILGSPLYLVAASQQIGIQGGSGTSWLTSADGRTLAVPFPIGGTFGRFLASPSIQPSQGNIGVDTADGVQLNVAGEMVVLGGTVDIGNDITIGAVAEGVTVPVSGDVTVSGSVEVSGGTVDIGNDVTIGAIAGGVTMPVSGSVNADITNATLTVEGTVDIGNNVTIGAVAEGVVVPISGSVNADITNSTLTVAGTVNIGNNVTIGSVAGGVTFDVSGTVNATIENASIDVATIGYGTESENTSSSGWAGTTTIAELFKFTNPSNSGVRWHIRQVTSSYTTLGAVTLNMDLFKLLNATNTPRAIISTEALTFTGADSGHFYTWSSEAPPDMDGKASFGGDHIFALNTEIVLEPGEAIQVSGVASVGNTIAGVGAMDYYTEPL